MDCTVTLVRKHRAWTAAVASVAGTVWSPLAGQPGNVLSGVLCPPGTARAPSCPCPCQAWGHSVSVSLGGGEQWGGLGGVGLLLQPPRGIPAALLSCHLPSGHPTLC